MYKNVIGDCPKQCDVGVFDFMDDYRKDLLLNLKDGEKSSEVYAGQGNKGDKHPSYPSPKSERPLQCIPTYKPNKGR